MKAQGKNFKEIGDAIGKSPAACANRHRELTDNSAVNGGAGPARPQNPNQPVQTQQNLNQNQHQQNHKGQKQQGDAGPRTIEMQPDNDFSKTDVSSRRTSSADYLLTCSQLELLCPIYIQARQDLWRDIASRFFDRTGKRYSPEVIAAKFAVLDDARAGR